MAPSAISAVGEKLQETLNGATENPKVASMSKDYKNVHDPSARITTDYGVKQSNTGV